MGVKISNTPTKTTSTSVNTAGSSFNKPAGGSFNKPAGGSFNKPAGGSFNKPASSSFNKPASSSFNKPAGSSFNKPAGAVNKPTGNVNKPAGAVNKPGSGLSKLTTIAKAVRTVTKDVKPACVAPKKNDPAKGAKKEAQTLPMSKEQQKALKQLFNFTGQSTKKFQTGLKTYLTPQNILQPNKLEQKEIRDKGLAKKIAAEKGLKKALDPHFFSKHGSQVSNMQLMGRLQERIAKARNTPAKSVQPVSKFSSPKTQLAAYLLARNVADKMKKQQGVWVFDIRCPRDVGYGLSWDRSKDKVQPFRTDTIRIVGEGNVIKTFYPTQKDSKGSGKKVKSAS